MTERQALLLTVCAKLLQKQKDASIVLDLLSEGVFYDGVEGDGLCLLEDIKAELNLEKDDCR